MRSSTSAVLSLKASWYWHFQVRRLVLADRHQVASHDQDVGGLEDRVAEQAVGGRFELKVTDDLFERRHALEARHRDEHAEEQVQLAGFGDERLEVDGAALGVHPDAQVIQDQLADVLADVARVVEAGGQGVVVGDDEEAVVLIDQPHPIGERPDVVSQVELPGRPVAGQDSPLLLRHGTSLVWRRRAERPRASYSENGKRPSSNQGRGAFSWCHPVSADLSRGWPSLRARPSA